jgi:hypothetical protein
MTPTKLLLNATEATVPEDGWGEYRKATTTWARRMDEPFAVETLEGTMEGQAGDYLMRGAHGELYPCAAAIFEDTYRPA